MGSIAFAITFTFIAAISSKAAQSATLMAILSFPLVIPILMTLTRLTKISLRLMTDTEYYKDILILASIDMILGSLVFVLFPYLWRD
jgi:heme exporter protein B